MIRLHNPLTKLIFVIAAVLSLFISTQAKAYSTFITVAQDGSGDFTTIQDAIYATKTFPWDDITIYIKNGVYQEKVTVYSWNTRVKMIGESRDNTIIRYADHFNKINKGRNSTFHTYTMKVAGDDFSAANLTIENTAGPVGQAVALHVEADRAAFYNVNIQGYQDTLYVAGEGHRSYFENCTVSGSVDFIFGAGTAYFNQCEIVSRLSNTYVTAASTPENQPYGLVFDHCRFVAPSNVSGVYLGRPWRQFAKTIIANSTLAKHIHPQGWHNWDDKSKEQTVTYIEMNNSGPGANMRKRVDWITPASSEAISPSLILRGWVPTLPQVNQNQ